MRISGIGPLRRRRRKPVAEQLVRRLALPPEQTDALLEDYIGTKLNPRLVWDKL